MLTMDEQEQKPSTSEAQRKATEKYAQTEKGKKARREAVNRYQDTPEGRERLEVAKKTYEAKPETKAKKAKWARERYHKLKAQKQALENPES